MANNTTNLLEAITALLAPVLNALDGLQFAGRHLHPPVIATLGENLDRFREPLREAHDTFKTIDWPPHLQDFAERMDQAATATRAGLDGVVEAAFASNPVMNGYRAVGQGVRAREALYPLAAVLPPLSRFFVAEQARDDEDLAARLSAAANPTEQYQEAAVGVIHMENDLDSRGGASLYVPEYYRPDTPMPLIVALHGGSGHGASFLHTWLVAARSAGAILLAPTSAGGTWSLQEPAVDHERLQGMVQRLGETYAIDRSRMLLTGMSDGGTFTLLSGLHEDSFATHLAPISGTFHPFLMEVAEPGRIRDLPVYMVHGALDWMFPVDSARLAHQTLGGAGVDITYREIDDLSHTYPIEENWPILQWLLQPK
ncbi:MAG: phospholipase [Pseudomonadota bacterium]